MSENIQMYDCRTDKLVPATQEMVDTLHKSATYAFKIRKIISAVSNLNAAKDHEKIDTIAKFLGV